MKPSLRNVAFAKESLNGRKVAYENIQLSSVPDIVSPGIRRELGVTKMRKLPESPGLKVSYFRTFGTFLYAPSHEQCIKLQNAAPLH
jgi:hypothetical protein